MTAFSVLYPVMRVYLGDLSEITPAYSDATLNMALSAALLDESGFSETVSNDAPQITPDVTTDEIKLRIAIRGVLILLRPKAHDSSYRTKILSVSRKGKYQQVVQLENRLRALESGGTISKTDTDVAALREGVTRFNEAT